MVYSCTDRESQIEGLMTLLEKLELEPAESVKLETDLLIAYSLLRIERRLESLTENEVLARARSTTPA